MHKSEQKHTKRICLRGGTSKAVSPLTGGAEESDSVLLSAPLFFPLFFPSFFRFLFLLIFSLIFLSFSSLFSHFFLLFFLPFFGLNFGSFFARFFIDFSKLETLKIVLPSRRELIFYKIVVFALT